MLLAVDLSTVLTVAYLGLLGLVCFYGLHRWWLVWMFYRHRADQTRPPSRFKQLPTVTVQLPMYNEGRVAERVIDAACRLDYPTDRLQIQVLDDSTDDSADIAAEHVQRWADRGVNIELRHREDRTGYKAGALAEGLDSATGDLIAIFDADFVPERDFLRRTVHHFTDPDVGMVQTRWTHLNGEDSELTRAQAIFLDAHFIVEHGARHTSGRWINFNGTAGIWRRAAIDQAGGWEHDTLTEDVDLSYRCQLAGWKFVYTPRVRCPAELPPEINAFKSQQHRWTKGSIQAALKLLPRILTSHASPAVKIEAFFHLTSPMVYLFLTAMVLLFYPAIVVNIRPWGDGMLWTLIGLSLFAMGTVSASVFYIASQQAQGRNGWSTLIRLPVLMAIGIGIAVNNARGCIEALIGHDSPFVRTPKYQDTAAASRGVNLIPTPSVKTWMAGLEVGLGLYVLACAALSMTRDYRVIALPFLLLFAAGYLSVGLASLHRQVQCRRAVAASG
ncbi:MAG: glycosyltransferase family 2 protein [Phycisphaeraceae bacterium]|nr:glycosyltransferase family 2 protein [Phycisphaeraceae bacterium]